MNKYTAYPIPPKVELESFYHGGNLSQIEVAHKYGVTQKVVHRWFRVLGIKSRVAAKRNQFGERNASWKGEAVGYAALHLRVEAKYGKPRLCSECGTTNAKRYEWANVSGKYLSVDDFKRLCKSCHAKYDGIGRNLLCKSSR